MVSLKCALHAALAFIFIGCVVSYPPKKGSQPHIVLITADDLGWNDVGWHNENIKTPYMNALARNGVVLNQSYALPLCTPSRSALMTGRYSFRTGRQNVALIHLVNTGLSTKYKILPQWLKELGYKTHIVGKWHLGYCNWSYTPTYRGFDTFFGRYLGYGDHFNHSSGPFFTDGFTGPSSLDFRNNTRIEKKYMGVYSSTAWGIGAEDVFANANPNEPQFLYLNFHAPHSPIQAPTRFTKMYSHIDDVRRRTYSAMVSTIDAAIGRMIRAMKRYGFFDNSVIIFTADNGGTYHQGASNWPLRGGKASLWEGGTRVASFVYGRRLKKRGYVNNKLIHITDWVPTIVHLAGGSAEKHDGVNQWEVISNDEPAVRKEMVYNIYDHKPFRGAIRMNDYKLMFEEINGEADCWSPPRYPGDNKNSSCDEPPGETVTKLMLFNVKEDPTERKNIIAEKPKLVRKMRNRLLEYSKQMIPFDSGEESMEGDPSLLGGVYAPGWCKAK